MPGGSLKYGYPKLPNGPKPLIFLIITNFRMILGYSQFRQRPQQISSGYVLLMGWWADGDTLWLCQQFAIGNGHWNSEFAHEKWWFSIVCCMFTRGYMANMWSINLRQHTMNCTMNLWQDPSTLYPGCWLLLRHDQSSDWTLDPCKHVHPSVHPSIHIWFCVYYMYPSGNWA